MTHALLIAAVLAAPAAKRFEDSEKGFRLELPKGWQHVKESSNQEHTVFRKRMRGRRNRRVEATLKVSVRPVPMAIGLTGVHNERLDDVRRRGGEIVEDEPEWLLGVRARQVKHTRDDGAITALEWITYRGGYAYTLVFECPTKRFKKLVKPDLKRFRTSFATVDKKSAPVGQDSRILGRWRALKKPGSIIELAADGSLVFGDATGSFAVSADTLVTLFENGAQQTFVWSIKNEDTLILRGDSGATRYRREQ